jgi:hypothetical protein
MTDRTLTIIIASLTIVLGELILIARFRGGRVNNEPGNPSAKAARGEIVVLAIVMIIGGLIVLLREM